MSDYAKNVTLPTRGLFYETEGDSGEIQVAMSDGDVTLEPMSTREEKLLAAGRRSNLDSILDKIFKRILVDCPVPPKKLKTVDRFFLLIQMRVISYGSDYRFEFKCSDCDRKVMSEIDLTELDVVMADEDMEEPFEVELPMSGDTIQWVLLTGEDEDAIRRYGDKAHSKGRVADGDPTYVYRMARHVVSVNGESRNIGDISKYVEELHGKDSLAFRNAIDNLELGVRLEIDVECSRCGWENTLALPFGPEFFRPRTRNRNKHTGATGIVSQER